MCPGAVDLLVSLETVSVRIRLDHHPIATEDDFREKGRVSSGLVKLLCPRAGNSLEVAGMFSCFH